MDCVAHQASLSMEFSRQEYWSGLPFPPPGTLHEPGIKLMSIASPALAGGLFTTVPPGNTAISLTHMKIIFCPPYCLSSVQFSSVAQSCPTLCDPMNCSTPDLPVHHQHLEFTQTQIHRVSDAIQPSHPLSSPSPAPNPS